MFDQNDATAKAAAEVANASDDAVDIASCAVCEAKLNVRDDTAAAAKENQCPAFLTKLNAVADSSIVRQSSLTTA